MKYLLLCLAMAFSLHGTSQKKYKDAMRAFQKDYVLKHEVVKDADKKYFRFFPVKSDYKVVADFERIFDTTGFIMKTSGKKTPKYFKYGLLTFKLKNSTLHLTVYQGEQLKATEKYKDYLFIPYTDLTSGEESYGGGRYLEFTEGDIVNNKLLLDFNKAYNPYCAYATGYNCPIPPRENDMMIAVKAGEKMFGKKH